MNHTTDGCVYRDSRPLRYAALGTGCAHLLLCLGRLRLPPSLHRIRNDLYCVEWGVKLDLTQPNQPSALRGTVK